MPLTTSRLSPRALVLFQGVLAAPLAAQVPAQPPPSILTPVPGRPLPSADQAQELLKTRPDLVQQLRDRIGAAGLTREQVHARLRAAGYPEEMLDPYLAGADTTVKVTPGSEVLDAVRVLGLVGAEGVDSLLALTDSAQLVLDSLRADSLADTSRTLKIFGLSFFRRSNSLFQPALGGPVDENYRLGPGDGLVLILTGEVERANELTVTRDGFIAIPKWVSCTSTT